MEPIPEGAPTVEAKVEQATYRVPGRSVILKVRVNNRGTNPIQVAEFETAGIRFLNGSVYKDDDQLSAAVARAGRFVGQRQQPDTAGTVQDHNPNGHRCGLGKRAYRRRDLRSGQPLRRSAVLRGFERLPFDGSSWRTVAPEVHLIVS